MPTTAKGLYVIESAWRVWCERGVLIFGLRTNTKLL